MVKAVLTDLQDFPGLVVIFQDFPVLENAKVKIQDPYEPCSYKDVFPLQIKSICCNLFNELSHNRHSNIFYNLHLWKSGKHDHLSHLANIRGQEAVNCFAKRHQVFLLKLGQLQIDTHLISVFNTSQPSQTGQQNSRRLL